MGYKSFEDLEVWKKGCRLAVRVYEILKECKEYGFKDQITKAVVSIPSNITEGAERDSINEFVKFLHISKDSAAELRAQISISHHSSVSSVLKLRKSS